MRKVYLTFLPVSSSEMAELLSHECIWEVLKEIRKAGSNGITADRISSNLHESPSTVYAALKQLERVGFIQGMKIRKWAKVWGRPSQEITEMKDSKGRFLYKRAGKSPKIYFEPCEKRAIREKGEKENPWGDVTFSKEFENEIGKLIKRHKGMVTLNSEIIKFLKNIYSDILNSEDSDVKKLLPNLENVCKVCKKSHELQEFVKAITFFSVAQILDSKEIKNLIDKFEKNGKKRITGSTL